MMKRSYKIFPIIAFVCLTNERIHSINSNLKQKINVKYDPIEYHGLFRYNGLPAL